MTKLRDSYDPLEVPVESGIFKIDDNTLELQVAGELPWRDLPEVDAQSDYERRGTQRYVMPKTAIRIRVQRFLNTIVYSIYQERRYKVVFALVSILSIALIWYSATFRIQKIDNAYTDLSELGSVETELLQIKEIWSAENMQQIADNVQNADKRRVFGDYQGLAIWLREKGVYAEQLGLGFSYSLGDGVPSKIDDMLELPIEIALTTQPDGDNSSYLSMLEFLRRTVSTLYYVEIVEAALESKGSGVTRTVATLRVWVHGKVKADG